MLAFVGLLLLAGLQTHGAPAGANPSRTNALVFLDDSGRAVTIGSQSAWARRRLEIRRAMEEYMGPLPGAARRCALEPVIGEEQDFGNHTRQLVSYQSEPGSRVPAYLLVPKGARARTNCGAVLALHPTDMEFGHRVVVEPIRSHYPPYAAELAERGFVVLAPAYPLMAGYQPDLKGMGYRSGTMKAIWDNIRGLDFLESLSYVGSRWFGVIGHSLGGHNAIFTAVFDDRLAAVVSSCGFDSFQDYMNGNIAGWTSDRYMPLLANYRDRLQAVPADFHEMLAALAPRPVLISAPLGDSNFGWRSVDEVVKAVRPVYSLHGKPDNLELVHPAAGHDFPREVRERAFTLFDRQLGTSREKRGLNR